MADRLSALHDLLVTGQSGVSGPAGVRLTEIRARTVTQFAAWSGTVAQVGAEAAKAAGVQTAPGPGQAATGANGTLLRVEPLKWWLISETEQPVMLSDELGATLDVSQSRSWLRAGGPQSARLLNHVLPIDLSERAFPERSVASTAFHHVGVTLWRDAQDFNLFLPRSFAASLCEILIETARQYGLEIT